VPDLTIQVQEVKGLAKTALVILNGSIDAKTVITFQTHLNSVKERGINRFILDMENVKYVNSTGLGYLINLSDSVNGEKGGIALVKVQPKVKVVFDMLGLNAFFKIYQTRDEALKHFTTEPIAGPTEQTVVLKSTKAEPPPAAVPVSARPAVAEAAPAPSAPTPRIAPSPAHVAHAPVAEAAPAAGELHIECRTCKALLAVKDVGTYKCPRCFTLFNYVGGGKASFLPRRKAMPLQLSLNFSKECTQGLLEFVKLVSQQAGFTDGTANDLVSAVRSTVDSILQYAYGGNDNNIYHVMLVTADSEIELRFADYGSSITAEKTGADGRPVFDQARSVMDKFELRNHPKGGNVLTLSKKAKSS
jgi:anti-anti-sigma factor